MSIHLIRDLDKLHRDLLSMCGTVEEMVHKAVEGLIDDNDHLVEELAAQDKIINQMDVQIEEECLKVLALHQPVAVDLRRITTVMKIISELERVADLGVHIAERASMLSYSTNYIVLEKLKEMSRIALEMLHCSIDSYVALDTDLARTVCAKDDLVDELNRETIECLVNLMQTDSEAVLSSIQLFSASRHLERIADHATNIAEDVIYLVEGEIVRHQSFIN